VIYYGTGGGLIKIGFTEKNLRQRTTAHRARYPDYIVLAAHDGTIHDEKQMHRQFRHLLVDGEIEWFHPGSDLLLHVVTVARGSYAQVSLPAAVRYLPTADDF
jgi:hypothetical protein